MQELTDLQDKFVHSIVYDGVSASESARRAGYSPASARQTASQLLDNPRIQNAIRREQFKLIGGTLASKAIHVLDSIMSDETAPAGARVDCARALLDRSGIVATAKPVMQDEVKKISEMNSDELIAFIADAKALIDAKKNMQTIEGEAVITVSE